jgi:hypothetical protein
MTVDNVFESKPRHKFFHFNNCYMYGLYLPEHKLSNLDRMVLRIDTDDIYPEKDVIIDNNLQRSVYFNKYKILGVYIFTEENNEIVSGFGYLDFAKNLNIEITTDAEYYFEHKRYFYLIPHYCYRKNGGISIKQSFLTDDNIVCVNTNNNI